MTSTQYWKINEHHKLQFQTPNWLRTPATIKHTSLSQRCFQGAVSGPPFGRAHTVPRPHVLRWPVLNRCCPGGPVKAESWPKIGPKETISSFSIGKYQKTYPTCPTSHGMSLEDVRPDSSIAKPKWSECVIKVALWRRGGDKGSTTSPWTVYALIYINCTYNCDKTFTYLLWSYLCMWKYVCLHVFFLQCPPRPLLF